MGDSHVSGAAVYAAAPVSPPAAGSVEDDGPIALADDNNEVNSHLLELQDALVQALSACGALGKIRAQLRAAAIGLLRADPELQMAAVGQTHPLPGMPLLTQVSLLLIEDFLNQLALRETAGVFLAEAGAGFASDEAHAALQQGIRGQLAHTETAGKGSLLEALVASALRAEPTAAASLPAKENGLVTPAVQASRADAGDLPKPLPTAPADARATEHREHVGDGDAQLGSGVRQLLDKYEESVPYSDADGPLDEDVFDEVEVL